MSSPFAIYICSHISLLGTSHATFTMVNAQCACIENNSIYIDECDLVPIPIANGSRHPPKSWPSISSNHVSGDFNLTPSLLFEISAIEWIRRDDSSIVWFSLANQSLDQHEETGIKCAERQSRIGTFFFYPWWTRSMETQMCEWRGDTISSDRFLAH